MPDKPQLDIPMNKIPRMDLRFSCGTIRLSRKFTDDGKAVISIASSCTRFDAILSPQEAQRLGLLLVEFFSDEHTRIITQVKETDERGQGTDRPEHGK